MLSDRDLLRSYFDGHVESLSHLLEKYTPHIVRYVQMIVHDLDLAKDLTQEILVKVSFVLNKKRYSDQGRFKSWLMRIAHNHVIDYIRSARQKRTLNEQTMGYDALSKLHLSEAGAEEKMIKNQFEQRMQNLISHLPKEQQEVIRMRYYEDMSFKEIAAKEGININTALGRVRYGLINLRKIMSEQKNASCNVHS